MTITTRARRIAVLVGLLVGLGALSLAATPGPSPTLDRHSAPTEIAARDVSTAPNATRPARSVRLSVLAALLSTALIAAFAVWTVAESRSRSGRRRLEQFFARRRGPPVLLVTH